MPAKRITKIMKYDPTMGRELDENWFKIREYPDGVDSLGVSSFFRMNDHDYKKLGRPTGNIRVTISVVDSNE